MRVIIAGSRDITDFSLIEKAVKNSGFNITEVISGGARGVDKLGEFWAKKHNIPCTIFHAKWDQLGKKAGPIRNQEMADYANSDPTIQGALIAVWNGVSTGTKDMISRMKDSAVHIEYFQPDLQ